LDLVKKRKKMDDDDIANDPDFLRVGEDSDPFSIQPIRDNRPAGLPPLDNDSLGVGEPRNNRKRRRRDFEDGREEMDEEREERERRRRLRDAQMVVRWRYVPLGDMTVSGEDLYYSSCDELESDGEGDDDDLFGSHDEKTDSGSQNEGNGSQAEEDNNIDDLLKLPESEEPPGPKKGKSRTAAGRFLREECFACKFGERDGETDLDPTKVGEMLRLLDQFYGHAENIAVAKMIHSYFKHEIWAPARGSLPMWRTRSVLDHIEHHVLEPRIFIGESIRKFTKYWRILEDFILKEEVNDAGEAHTVVNDKNMKMVLDVQRRIAEMYKMNPSTMNFYNESYKIDMSSMGKGFNQYRHWKIGIH
jgi:hypothetical protein